MIEETNKYNLKRSINEIPVDRPNPDLWEKIEKNLDYIDVTRNIPEDKPDPELWNRIDKDLTHKPQNNSKYKYLVYSVLLALVLVYLIYYFAEPINKNTDSAKLISQNSNIDTTQQNSKPYESKRETKKDNLSEKAIEKTTTSENPPATSKNNNSKITRTPIEQKTKKIAVVSEKPKVRDNYNYGESNNTVRDDIDIDLSAKGKLTDQKIKRDTLVIVQQKKNKAEHISDGLLSHIVPISIGIDLLKQRPEIHPALDHVSSESSNINNPQYSNDYEKKDSRPALLVGVFYTPENVYNLPNSITKKNGFSIDLSIGYYYHNTLIETGIGIGRYNEFGNSSIDYTKMEITGSYNYIDSVTYNVYVDPVTHTTAIDRIYHYSIHDVYDSIRNILEEQVSNQYTYLNLPLIIGFKKDFKKLSLTIKGGACVSILIHKKGTGLNIVGNNIIISKTINEPPARIKTYWQLMGSIGCQYQLTNKLNIAIEPTIKYYMNSIYQEFGNTNEQIYSFGIRTGILYRF